MKSVATAEVRPGARAMLKDPRGEIGGDTDVERAAIAIRHDVHPAARSIACQKEEAGPRVKPGVTTSRYGVVSGHSRPSRTADQGSSCRPQADGLPTAWSPARIRSRPLNARRWKKPQQYRDDNLVGVYSATHRDDVVLSLADLISRVDRSPNRESSAFGLFPT